jgi:hypothetical protein
MRLIPRNPVQDWLSAPVISDSWIYLDRWTFVHFSVGLFLGYLFLLRWKSKNAWIKVFLILLLYEIWENNYGQWIFEKESWTDLIWDLIIGMGGYILVYLFYKMRKTHYD